MENNTIDEVKVNDENDKLPLSKKDKIIKIVNITLNTIFYIFIFLLLIFSITQIKGSDARSVKSIFGRGYEVVLSQSMSPGSTDEAIVDESRAVARKDSFTVNDLILVKVVKEKDKTKFQVGDIITFWDTISPNPTGAATGFLNTHRIVEVVKNSSGAVTGYVTQGDCYLGTQYDYTIYTADPSNGGAANLVYKGYAQNVSLSDIEAVYTGKLSGFGKTIKWVSNPKKGFIIVIIIPTILFLIFELVMVIFNVMSIKTQKISANATEEKEKMRAELEAEKEKMKQELLEQLRKEALEEQKKKEESISEEEKMKENGEDNSSNDSTVE
ncbi:MAG: hypothetical protein ACI35W_07160 [Anaeroplasmataceae bacterium]